MTSDIGRKLGAVGKILIALMVFATATVTTAGSASASYQAQATTNAPTLTAAPTISFGCGSVPTFVSSNDGTFTGDGVNIRSGPYTSCTSFGLGYRGNTLKVWCLVFNNNGVPWVYLNDRTTGVRGWSAEQYVTWSGGIPGCS